MLMAGVALMAAACEQEFAPEGVGSVDFDINLAAETRAVNGSDFTPETLKVRIYRADGSLIRRYTSMEAIPAPMYLVSGDYSILVEAGDQSNTAFLDPNNADQLKQLLCYKGREDFIVSAHANTSIAVKCPTLNTKTAVMFNTNNTENENGLLSDVKIQLAAMNTSATTEADFEADVQSQEAPALVLNGTATGYFLMPEEVTTIAWSFSATHPEDGQIEQVGRITNVQAGQGYTLNFVYSKTPDGQMGIQVLVDDSVDEFDSGFDFKPQPEISGAGINAAATNVYKKGSDIALVCESINDLESIALGNKIFYQNGAAVTDAIPGLTVTSVSPTKVTFTLAASYFAALKGANQALEFDMVDTGGDYSQKLLFVKTGLVPSATTYDLWANTATFEAAVTDAASSVVVRFRKQGTSSWAETPLTKSGDVNYKATSTASWSSSTNANGHTVYTPNTDKSIFANATYEYQLVVDGEVVDSATLTTSTSQSIPYATFEDTSLSCWGTSNNPAPYWGSGNNSMASSLCKQGSYTGQQGSYCATLKANSALGGNLAAGNLFTGSFLFNLPNGTVSFGVKYNYEARPAAIKVRLWHQIGDVTHTKHAAVIPSGDPDQASVQVVIIDWDTQHKVTSGTSTVSGVWSPEDGANTVSAGKVIGYGVIYPQGTTSGSSMVDTEIPIVWYDKTTKPSKNYTLIVSAATSRYGDYMNGCETNVMYVDDFRWSY